MVLNYVALGFIFFLILMAAVIIVQLGSLPGKIAHRRGHPKADAVNAASWISFVSLGALWPLAFVWAFFPSDTSSEDGDSPSDKPQVKGPSADQLQKLESRLAALEANISKLQPVAKEGQS